MKIRKLLSLLLILCLLTASLAACGNSEKNNTSTKDTSADTTGSTTADADDSDDDEDLTEIVVAYYTGSPISEAGVANVQSAINDITVPEINVSVKLLPMDLGTWDQQVNLMLTANEQLDLMPTFFYGAATFSNMVTQKQLISLNDLLNQYGQDILGLLPESWMETTTLNDTIYGVPIYKDNVGGCYYYMRTDILEELDMVEFAENISSMEEIETLLALVKEKTDLAPLVSSGTSGVFNFTNTFGTGKFADLVTFERFVSDYVGALSSNPEEVICIYDTDIYKETCTMLEDWYNAGYIYSDAANNDDTSDTLIRSGIGFSFFNGAETSTVATGAMNCGYPMTYIKVTDQAIQTSSINTLNWVIPTTAKEPAAAMKFMNMLYTDARIVNLFNYGVEGEGYVVTADGRFAFPEGKDMSSVGYYVGFTWLFGNQFIAGLWETDSPTLREDALAVNENAEVSPLLGFVATTEGLDTEIAAVTSAQNEYQRPLNCGVLDVEKAIPEFQAKLAAGGVNTIIEQVQTQLNDWIAENK